jgi:pentatricopeptide repeat protein
MMSEFDVSPDEAIYSILIERHAMEGQPEMCLRLLATMAENGISPDLTSMSRTISLLAKTGYPALATDLAIEFEDQGVRRLESTIWLGCLEGCTQAMNVRSPHFR